MGLPNPNGGSPLKRRPPADLAEGGRHVGNLPAEKSQDPEQADGTTSNLKRKKASEGNEDRPTASL